MITLGGGPSRDHSLPEVSLDCRVGLSRWPGEDNHVLRPLPCKFLGSPVHERIKKYVASVFILTSKTLVIATFMILMKVKLRSASNHR